MSVLPTTLVSTSRMLKEYLWDWKVGCSTIAIVLRNCSPGRIANNIFNVKDFWLGFGDVLEQIAYVPDKFKPFEFLKTPYDPYQIVH